MPEAIAQLYNSLDVASQKEVNDFIIFLLSRKKKDTTSADDAINEVLGILTSSEAEEIRNNHLNLKDV
ncbi:MAG: hypothetical protein MJZ91_10285 [Bacteroidales bacterium]|nr:hypothetical protein [Bacteroidales bacterium]